MTETDIVAIRSISATISEYSTHNDGEIYFHVSSHVITSTGNPFRAHAQKCFSDFSQLHDELNSMLESWTPRKLSVFGNDQDLRMEKLEEYLNQLFNNGIKNSAIFPSCVFEFLCLPDFSKLSEDEASKLTSSTNNGDFTQSSYANSKTSHKPGFFVEPSIPLVFHDKIQECYNALSRIASAEDGVEGWQQCGNSKNVQSFVCNESSPVIRKVQGIINCPPRMAHELLWNPNTLKKVSNHVERIDPVDQLDNHTKLEHFIMKAFPLVATRDLVLLRHWRITRGGEVVHCELDVNPSDIPKDEHYTRAEQTMGGTYILPVKNNPYSCQVVIISNYDAHMAGMSSTLKKVANSFLAKRMVSKVTLLQELARLEDKNACLKRGALYNSAKVTKGNNNPRQVEIVTEEKSDESSRFRANTSPSPSLQESAIPNAASVRRDLSRYQRPSFQGRNLTDFGADGYAKARMAELGQPKRSLFINEQSRPHYPSYQANATSGASHSQVREPQSSSVGKQHSKKHKKKASSSKVELVATNDLHKGPLHFMWNLDATLNAALGTSNFDPLGYLIFVAILIAFIMY